MATIEAQHATMVYELRRFARRLACKLLEVDRQTVYASRCSACRWVGPPRLDPWQAEVDGVAHEVEAE